MADAIPTDHLSKLSTHWQELAAAHGEGEDARAAQCAVLQRYCGAVYHYLAAATGDPHTADDLAQEFALRFVRGDFHRLHPARGRFRDFLKTVLYHLIVDHYRARQTAPGPLPRDSAIIPAGGLGPEAAEREFTFRWREELLDRAWEELRQARDPAGPPFYAALRWRAEHPDRPSADAAEELGRQLGRPVTPAAYRQVLHRAREKFADLLLAEVAFSLGTDAPEQVEQELAELELLAYCQPALERRRVATPPPAAPNATSTPEPTA